MTDNLTPADLIYLYLDGEADSLQQTTMFASLATDVDLQQEFTEALSMKKAFERERTSSRPPMYLSERVFRDAGILQKTIGAGILGSGLWLWLRRASVPVGALLLGSILTFFAMNWNSPSQKSNEPVVVAAAPATSLPTFAKDEIVPPLSPAVPMMRETHHRSRPVVSSSSTSASMAASVQSDEIPSDFRIEQGTLSDADMYSSLNGNRRVSMVNVANGRFNLGRQNDLTVRLDGLASGAVLGSTNPANSVRLLNDPSVSVLYTLDEAYSLGICVGRNSFAISGVTANGVFLQNPTYTSACIEVQYLDTQSELFGGQIYGKLDAGITNSQPTMYGIVRFNGGVSYRAWLLRLSAGLAADALIFNSKPASSPIALKVSFITGISYSF